MSGRQCTRARDEKLDIILMATEWEEQFPLSNVSALTHISDTSISSNSSKCQFKFKMSVHSRISRTTHFGRVWILVPLQWKDGKLRLGDFANTYGDGPRIQVVH